MISSTKLPDSLVILVHKRDVSMSMAIAGIVVPLEAEDDIFALPSTGLEVGSPDTVDTVSGPDEVTVIAEDVGTGLARPVLLRGRVR